MKHSEIISATAEFTTIQVSNKTHVVRPYTNRLDNRPAPHYNGKNYMLCGILDQKVKGRRSLAAFKQTWAAQQKVTSKQVYNR